MPTGRAHVTKWKENTDFRITATLGVAIAAITLLLPIAILNIFTGNLYVAIGSIGIVCMLTANTFAISRDRDHQKLTLYVLVPAGMAFMVGVFVKDGIIGTLWCYPSVIACFCMLSEKRAWIAVGIILGTGFPMAWLSLPTEYAYRVVATLTAVSLFSGILVRVIDTQNKRLKEQLKRDPLTGLLNRLTLKTRLQAAISDKYKGGGCSSILAMDVDHFKQLNDTFGHEQGDVALCTLAGLILENLDSSDACFRTGGEEFLVLLRDVNENEAYRTAEKIRQMLENSEIIPDHYITISIGIATYDNDEDWTHWVKRADDNLYSAKRAGRNLVAVTDIPEKARVSMLKTRHVREVTW